MITVKDFAQMQGCSETIIYRHIRKHKTELGDNIQKRNGKTWITEDGVEFIRNLMMKDPIVVSDNNAEVEMWRKKYEEAIEAQNKYLAQVTPLLAKASEQIQLAERSKLNQERADALEAQNADLSVEIENKDKELEEVKELLKKAELRLINEQSRALTFKEWRERRKNK